MERYIPLTGIDLVPASLLIDSQAPLDVLQAMADYRIRAVTQVLENIAFRSELESDSVVLSDFAQLLVIPCAMVAICWTSSVNCYAPKSQLAKKRP